MDFFSVFLNSSPKITRVLFLTSITISMLTWLEIISPLLVYYNYDLIVKKFQIWRLFTNFFYFGNFSVSLIFHLMLFCRNSHFLEKQVFHGNSADYLYFLMITMAVLCFIGPFTGILFMSNALSFVMTYYWGRKCKHLIVNFMGVFTLRAPFLPWFYLVLTCLLEGDFKVDLLGIIVGHIYFYFKDIFPRLKSCNGIKLLETPRIINILAEKLGMNNDVALVDDFNEVMF